MNRYTRAGLILALIALACSLSPSSQDRANSQIAALQVPAAGSKQQDARVRTVPFRSAMVGKTLPYNVLLPVGYDDQSSRNKRYPVLYLLHGLTGHYTNWLEHTKLADYAKPYELIIVMPEGNNGWYTDSATAPRDKYESYIVRELIPDVEKHFRAKRSRAGRAIAGLSMGGYGALKFGVKYPEMFAFAGSMSGVIDAATWTKGQLGLDFIWKTLAPVFGAEDNPSRKTNDLASLFREVPSARIGRLPYVYLDCGTEDLLFSSSRNLATILTDRKIPHEYRQLPGAHGWAYWDARVPEVLRITARITARK